MARAERGHFSPGAIAGAVDVFAREQIRKLRQATFDLITAKGDLLVGTGAGTLDNLAAGTNDQILTAASGESTGLKWSWPRTPACQVRMTGQSITDAVPVVLVFDTDTTGTEDLDLLGWHENTTEPSRITPTIAGWYRASAGAVLFQSDGDYIRAFVEILKNGAFPTPLLRTEAPGNMTPSISLGTRLLQMNGSTDYLEARAYQDNTSGNANTVDGWFVVELVYPT